MQWRYGMSNGQQAAKKIPAIRTEESKEIKLDTPQQDRVWTESQKLEWIKNSSARLIKVFNTQE
jgi:hypothetical protein